MPPHDFDVPLDDAALEWIRYRFTTQGADVTVFTVQYETTIDGERVPVVRYDTAHGFAHRDRMNRQGEEIRKETVGEGLSLKEALNLGEQDIKANWPRYREEFFRGTP